jgi:putative Ca2+/H+ antiporter (TMEM165/GDT1 family)
VTALELFATVFGVIFVAELPDKTALAALVLATRHKPLPVWLGASFALTVQSGVAVGGADVDSQAR